MLIFPLINDTSRKIIHIDMDAFFASVEVRDNPDLRGKPVVIAKDPRKTGGRGVVSTCSYEARAFGIHSAMSSKEAYERCPQAFFIRGDYEKYRKIGMEIRAIFKRYTDLVEPMSIDEAFLDVTNNKQGIKSAVKMAMMIQNDIWKELHLTCSAGVSYNKFLAKLASDFKKPAGLTIILPEEAQSFLERLPVEKFHGVGKKSVEKLHAMGIMTGKDLLTLSEMTLIDHFGRFGYELYRKARGISDSPVTADRIRKSIGSERTYGKLLYNEQDIKVELSKNIRRVSQTLVQQHRLGKIVIIKVRYGDFTTVTKRHSLTEPTQKYDDIEQEVYTLYDSLAQTSQGVRLLGVTLTALIDEQDVEGRLF